MDYILSDSHIHSSDNSTNAIDHLIKNVDLCLPHQIQD